MKNILVLIHDDTGQEARLQVALDITRMLNGHLTCLDVVIPPAAMTDDTLGGMAGVTLLADEISREAWNRTRVERRLAREDVSWEWAEATGRIAPSLRDASRFADLIVVNRQLHDFPIPDMRAVAGEVIARSRKPVLAVPEDVRRLDAGCAMIAWNGSTSAMASLRQSIPLLARSERVLLVQVDDGADDGSAEAAASYVSRHDIHVRIERVAALAEGVGATLIDHAIRHHAGILIAGGYGHLRVGETLFGGVTRELLTNAPCPIFMAH